jgi:hypothetical protein
MKLISHRGNINGKIEKFENNPNYIDTAIEQGYDVEIDLRYHQHEFWLGHDEPNYEVTLKWLTDRKDFLWIHCKDLITIDMLRELQIHNKVNLHYFFHDEDDCTITSKGDLWVYPGKQPVKNSIAVMPEWHRDDVSLCKGICSDNIINFKE